VKTSLEEYLYFSDTERDLVAKILARLCLILNPAIDDWEAEEIIRDFIEERELGTLNVNELGLMVMTTIYDPKRDGVMH